MKPQSKSNKALDRLDPDIQRVESYVADLFPTSPTEFWKVYR
jgi:hypothetical protein